MVNQHHPQFMSTGLPCKLHHLISFYLNPILPTTFYCVFFPPFPSQQEKGEKNCFAWNAALTCDIVDWDENAMDNTSSVLQLTNAAVKYNCLIWLSNYMYEAAPVLNQTRMMVAWSRIIMLCGLNVAIWLCCSLARLGLMWSWLHEILQWSFHGTAVVAFQINYYLNILPRGAKIWLVTVWKIEMYKPFLTQNRT